MKNPYLQLREATGLTQRGFEQAADLSHTVVVSLEAGMFPEVSKNQIEKMKAVVTGRGLSWDKTLGTLFGTTDFDIAYKVWLVRERRAAAPSLGTVEVNPTATKSPFLQYVEGTVKTRYAFCQALKVPQASVMRYGSGTTLTMPKSIRDALLDAGKTPAWCDRLEDGQMAWHANRAKKLAKK